MLNSQAMNVETRTGRRPLPTGIQTFSRLRSRGCYHVDKTPLIRQMIEEGDFYFLSRPRRFGKSLLYMGFRTTRVDVKAEEASSHGRSDMVLLHENQVFVLEFKMVKDKTETEQGLDSAITQIRGRGYAEKYRDRGEPVHLIGMVFGRKERNLLEIRVEEL